jgi:hypothetical protein
MLRAKRYVALSGGTAPHREHSLFLSERRLEIRRRRLAAAGFLAFAALVVGIIRLHQYRQHRALQMTASHAIQGHHDQRIAGETHAVSAPAPSALVR